jgi:transposase
VINSNGNQGVTQLSLIEEHPKCKLMQQKLGEGKCILKFKPALPAQLIWIPPNCESELAPDHLAFKLIKLIKMLDLSHITKLYENKASVGRSPYDPVRMLTFIVYARSCGTRSVRTLATLAAESVPCRVILGNQTPHSSTISRFQNKIRNLFEDLFQQVLAMAFGSGLVSLEHVSIDGSKVQANASKTKNMTYERMCQKIESLPAEIEKLELGLAAPHAVARQEIESELKRKRGRLDRARKGKAALDRRAMLQVQQMLNQLQDKNHDKEIVKPVTEAPKPLQQYNFTDPDSRIMSFPDGNFDQAYNTQIAVDSKCQIIVANSVVIDGNDKRQLVPLVQQLKERLGKNPKTLTADTGYCSEEALSHPVLNNIKAFVATPPPPTRQTRARKNAQIHVAQMRKNLETGEGKAAYKQRKAIVEPVFGQIKASVLEFDRFSWRGLDNASQEWHLVCLVHNLLKIVRFDSRKAA